MPPICTHHSTVQPWECDENEHMNAQFYAERFQQAAAKFARVADLGDRTTSEQRLTLWFYSEAQAAQCLMVESAMIEDFPHGYAIGHRLVDASTRELLAAAIDQLPSQPQTLSIPSRRFEPRFDVLGVAPNHTDAPETEHEALAMGGFPSSCVTIAPPDVDADGYCPHRFYVGLFGNGAAISWDVMGLSHDVLQSHRWGCMVTNLSISILQPVTSGTIVKQVSRILELRSRTVTMRHDQFNSETGEAIACALATGMLVSLDTRRAIKFPSGKGC